ncbi:MAG: aspartate-alanine antiporter [Bacteroidales bacterium]|nr:aspartate-alanine antiporter [Bacteroidales bacterium]
MEIVHWVVDTLRENPAIAIFLVLGLGFWIGRLKYKNFSLGTVTSVLLVGVIVGQLDIPVSGPLKSVSFLLFLFAIGYSVGPQFFRALKGSGIKQVIFALVMCVLCLLCTWGTALLFHYNVGEALGLFAGAQTISAVIGVGQDTINSLDASGADKASWSSIIPVCYAVTYIFGTIGSAWILGSLGPAMLGGIKKVRAQTAELAAKMNETSADSDPAVVSASHPVVYRAYKADSAFFSAPKSVEDIENHIASLGRRIFVERIKVNDNIIDRPAADTILHQGDEIVLSGRRESVVGDESWIGPEIADYALLSFPVENIPVMIARKKVSGMTIEELRRLPEMDGVLIVKLTNSDGVKLPVLAKTELHSGYMITLQGQAADVEKVIPVIGYADRPTTATDMVFVGIGIFIGALIGAVTLHIGGIPVSLSTSGGALIAGLVMGWLRSRHPSFGRIPSSSLWILNNLGLNLFIAVIGISSGPTFVSGIQQVGWMLFVAGVIATTVPLVLGIVIGDKIFHFPAAINLGCVAGSRVTTASLGAIQDNLKSTIPAMGYTVTYAIGNTLLILMGVIMATFF